jgi:hypothetical protein
VGKGGLIETDWQRGAHRKSRVGEKESSNKPKGRHAELIEKEKKSSLKRKELEVEE